MPPWGARDPWKTTRLIGGKCKLRNECSLPVLMVDYLTTFVFVSSTHELRIPFTPSAFAIELSKGRSVAQQVNTSGSLFQAAGRAGGMVHACVAMARLRVGGRSDPGNKFSGGYTDGATPDPIPNSAVKPVSADDSATNAKVGDCRE